MLHEDWINVCWTCLCGFFLLFFFFWGGLFLLFCCCFFCWFFFFFFWSYMSHVNGSAAITEPCNIHTLNNWSFFLLFFNLRTQKCGKEIKMRGVTKTNIECVWFLHCSQGSDVCVFRTNAGFRSNLFMLLSLPACSYITV